MSGNFEDLRITIGRNGEEEIFIIVDSFMYDDRCFLVIAPEQDAEDDEAEDLEILFVEAVLSEDEEEFDSLRIVSDEEEYEELFEAYTEEDEDFDEDDYDEELEDE